MAETITGVALLCEHHGLIALPAPCRHHHLYALMAFLNLSPSPEQSGFVTSLGRYVTREEAFVMTGKGRSEKTFSEDLW